MDDFEQKLQRQPLQQIPDEWRGEILTAADEVETTRRAARGRRGAASLPLKICRLQLNAAFCNCNCRRLACRRVLS